MKSLLIILTLIFSQNTFAKDICQFDVFSLGGTKIQTGQFRSGACFVSLRPRKINNGVYRSHLFTTNGQWMIFNSFGSTDGARVLYFPPLLNKQHLELHTSDDAITLNLINGETIHFDIWMTAVANYSGGEFLFDSEISEDNEGGLIRYETTNGVFDLGFQMGGSPAGNPLGKTLWRQTCDLKNTQLFDYDSDGEPFWKITTLKALNDLLKVCPDTPVEGL